MEPELYAKVVTPEEEDRVPPDWLRLVTQDWERSRFDETGGYLCDDDREDVHAHAGQ